ncbi:exodeoxyribonuclease VII small subunit [Azoarcus taiwanensis]|uniref:Exodeoxyribonuclease 7 small subunit n=1 Tax=Azoarcus taiwanensis TaxID=666964 RepID=A0A972JBS1_9RHOO|nr:exodeoxyribonuclease VII small subunit [Azoarcus taiwanensis]NMG04433.1 exodeoxyribonuclease VII small subunit [Azoarcus taiwanensis]
MTKPSGSPKSFESAIAELERIVEEMEGSAISLEDGLARYQRGVTLLKYCRNTLTEAEQRILRLEGDALVESGDQEA